jgi:hypothetical protein
MATPTVAYLVDEWKLQAPPENDRAPEATAGRKLASAHRFGFAQLVEAENAGVPISCEHRRQEAPRALVRAPGSPRLDPLRSPPSNTDRVQEGVSKTLDPRLRRAV